MNLISDNPQYNIYAKEKCIHLNADNFWVLLGPKHDQAICTTGATVEQGVARLWIQKQGQAPAKPAHAWCSILAMFFFSLTNFCLLKFSAFYISNFRATQTEQCNIQPVVSKNQYQEEAAKNLFP
jgi:hypothetical protein